MQSIFNKIIITTYSICLIKVWVIQIATCIPMQPTGNQQWIPFVNCIPPFHHGPGSQGGPDGFDGFGSPPTGSPMGLPPMGSPPTGFPAIVSGQPPSIPPQSGTPPTGPPPSGASNMPMCPPPPTTASY